MNSEKIEETTLNKRPKTRYIYIILFALCSLYTILSTAIQWKVIPNAQDDIQYSLGVVGINKTSDGTAMLTLLPSALLKDTMYFGCSYSMNLSANGNKCLDEKTLALAKGEFAKVGWYEPKGVFTIKNPYPQMVSIEVDGKYLKSFNETKLLSDGYNNASVILTSITLALYLIALQVALFLDKKARIKRKLSVA